MVLLSVVIPVFNSEKYLRNTLDSVLSQDIADMEVVCINDGSTDTSLTILKEYSAKDCRIRIIDQENHGAGVSRNIGLENSSGKYVHFMDSDDWLEPDAYRTILDKMERTRVDMCVFQRIIYNNISGESNLQVRAFDLDNYVTDFKSNPVFFIHSPVVPWNKIIRGSLIRDNNLKFDDIPCANDRSFYFASVKCAKSIMVCKDPLIHYRINNSKSLIGYTRSIHFDAHFESYYSTMDHFQDEDKAIQMMITDAAMVDMNRFFQSANIYYKLRIYFQLHDFLKNIDFSGYYKNPQRYPWVHPLGFIRKYRFGFPLYFYRVHKNYVRKHPKKAPQKLAPASERVPALGLIVSFTSYPERIPTIHIMVESVFRQTIAPEKTILWLSDDQFPEREKNLPESLRSFLDKGLEIRFVQGDLKPHKKYYYAMQEFPDKPVITLDDDVIYPEDTLSKLWNSYQSFPHAVSAIRAHRIAITDGKIGKYNEWTQNEPMFYRRPSMLAFATGVGGVLYPPGCMPPVAFDKNLIEKHCLLGDDIWLKCMEILTGTPTVSADVDASFEYVEGTQDTALWRNNQSKGYNDAYFSDIASVLEKKGYESLERKISSTLLLRKRKLALLIECGSDFNADSLAALDSLVDDQIRILAYNISNSDIESLHGHDFSRTLFFRNNNGSTPQLQDLARFSDSDWLLVCDLFHMDYIPEAIGFLNSLEPDSKSILGNNCMYSALGIDYNPGDFDSRCVPIPTKILIYSGITHLNDHFSRNIIAHLCSGIPEKLNGADAELSLYSDSDWENIRYLVDSKLIEIEDSGTQLMEYIKHEREIPPASENRQSHHHLPYKCCPICNSLSEHFLISGVSLRDNVMCPVCRSYERHRALMMIIRAMFGFDRQLTFVNFPEDMYRFLGTTIRHCGLYQIANAGPIDIACICYAIHSKDDIDSLFHSVKDNMTADGALIISIPLKNVHGSVPLAYELGMDIFELRERFHTEGFDLDINCIDDLFDLHTIDSYGLNKKEIIFIAKQSKDQ